MTFGERLTQLRKDNGFTTRNEFADKLGIPSTTLRNYETDAREPGHTFLKQVSEFFNVSVDYLLCLTDDKDVLNSFRIRTSEQNIIKKYRDLDDHGREMVDFTLRKEWERSTAEKDNIVEIPAHLQTNAAHARTDIDLPEDVDTSEDDIMDDEDF